MIAATMCSEAVKVTRKEPVRTLLIELVGLL